MTKKIAIFVEGQTEQEFTIKLLSELAGRQGITFELYTQFGGQLSFIELRSHQNPVIHALIINCCNDGQVKSQIIDQYNSLVRSDYSLIIGLRDVYPFSHNDIPKLQSRLLVGLPSPQSIPIHLHLAILEIEAWFLEELTHFSRIDAKITENEIISNGFDFNKLSACDLSHPAETLKKIYQSVGKSYGKNKSHVERTVEALSYEELYINTRQKAPSLDKFINSLEDGLML